MIVIALEISEPIVELQNNDLYFLFLLYSFKIRSPSCAHRAFYFEFQKFRTCYIDLNLFIFSRYYAME